MKRFTQKFFLLAIGMILSVGAYAQDEITHHWPEVRFTIVKEDGTPTDGLMYHVPGWDAWLRYKQLSNGSNVVSGHVRVQKYENTSGLNYKARLVTRYAISSDNRLKVPELKDNTPLYVKINGEGEPINIRGLKYKDVFEMETGPDGTSYDVVIIDEDKVTVSSTYKDADNNKEYFKIPTSMTHTPSSEKSKSIDNLSLAVAKLSGSFHTYARILCPSRSSGFLKNTFSSGSMPIRYLMPSLLP